MICTQMPSTVFWTITRLYCSPPSMMETLTRGLPDTASSLIRAATLPPPPEIWTEEYLNSLDIESVLFEGDPLQLLRG
jgi:hypothetical protein